MVRLAEGDDEAFNLIYLQYNAMIFSAAIVYVKDFHKAQDIVQQVFIKIWEKRASLTNVDSLQDYIIVLSRNLIYDQFRRRNIEMRKMAELAERYNEGTANGSSERMEDQQYAKLLHSAIGQLPPQQKKIYLLIHDEQMSYEEVASILNLSKFTVKKHLELARRFVRNYVSQYLHIIVGISLLPGMLILLKMILNAFVE